MFTSRLPSNLLFLIKNGVSTFRPMSVALRGVSTESSEFSKISQSTPLEAQNVSQLEKVISEIKTFKIENDLKNLNQEVTPIREAWVENISTPHSIKVGLLQLHPQIFSAFPRPDVIQENYKWQTLYKHVDWRNMPTRAELKGVNKKPWPQKGLGKARHGSRLSPQWVNGGWAHGPRGPKTYFYMLPWHKRVAGLVSLLSLKFSQDDIRIVESFEDFPQEGTAAHVQELCETRGWGPSVLFVDKMSVEDAPKSTSVTHFESAMESIDHINMLPVYGLNVYSMLKHETLVLTVDAVKDIQEKLLFQMNRIDLHNVVKPYKPDGVHRL